MAYFQKRGDSWRAEIKRKDFFRSESFPTKALAQAWATKTEAEYLAGKRGFTLPHTCADAFEKYALEVSPSKKGARWETLRLANLSKLDVFQAKIQEIKAPELARWRDLRLRSVSSGTVRREMVLVGSVFEVARREWEWIRSNPLKEVSKPASPPSRYRRVWPDESKRICEKLKWEEGAPVDTVQKRVAVAFLFAIETAMRAGEIQTLSVDTVYLERRYARLETAKNGEGRDVPLSARAIELLRSVKPVNRLYFEFADGSLDTLFRRARDAAGIEGLTFHDSRHEACTQLAKKLSVIELARVLGHRDLKSLMIYFNPTAEELAAKL